MLKMTQRCPFGMRTFEKKKSTIHHNSPCPSIYDSTWCLTKTLNSQRMFTVATLRQFQAWRLLLRLKVIALDMKTTDSQSLRQNLAEHTASNQLSHSGTVSWGYRHHEIVFSWFRHARCNTAPLSPHITTEIADLWRVKVCLKRCELLCVSLRVQGRAIDLCMFLEDPEPAVEPIHMVG